MIILVTFDKITIINKWVYFFMTNITAYSDDVRQSSEFLRLAISMLAKYRIPVDPHNYQMGYECVSGKNQALMDDLTHLIEKSKTPSQEQLESLYKSYFVQDEAFFEIMRQEIRKIIVEVLHSFGHSGGQLSNYSQTLNRFVDILDSRNSSTEMLEETHKVLDETRSMERIHKQLENQMSGVIAEINSLRKELEQVKEESKLDTLTGISNRRAFDVTLEQMIFHARKNAKSFCLLLLDIDFFKKFNDEYGHLVGDKVLRYVAASLKRNIKGNDFLARFGGEEFVIILPATKISGAMAVAEQICDAISSGNLTDKENNTSYGKLTISIGVTQFRASDLSDDIVHRADRALYLAKDRGRNRVEKL